MFQLPDDLAELGKVHEYQLSEDGVKAAIGKVLKTWNAHCIYMETADGFELIAVGNDWRQLRHFSDWEIRTSAVQGSLIRHVLLRRRLRALSADEAESLRGFLLSTACRQQLTSGR